MKTLMSLCMLLGVLAVAHAQTYNVLLDPAQDGGGTRSGSGSVTLVLSGTTLSSNGSFTGLSGNASAAHIHGPSGPFPASAGVLYDLGSMTTFGSTSGTIGPGTVSIVPKGSGGSYTVAQQLADLNNSLWYINVHSSAFGGGEIRGAIIPVPEPSTWALFGLGGAGLIAMMRRRLKS